MKLVMKTGRKIAIEVTAIEIENKGFDYIWDKIRTQYPKKKFDVHSISTNNKNEDIIFVELTSKGK